MLTGLPSQAHARGMLAEAMDLVCAMMISEGQTTSSLRRTNSEHIPEEPQQAQEPPSALFIFMRRSLKHRISVGGIFSSTRPQIPNSPHVTAASTTTVTHPCRLIHLHVLGKSVIPPHLSSQSLPSRHICLLGLLVRTSGLLK